MKLLFGFAAMLLLTVSLSAQVVNIPDAGLEGKVRDALSKPAGDITQADMLGLTSLIADYAGITDLTGLEFATNLQTLSLYSNDVTDLGPIAELTSLTAVYISFNPNLKDVSPLSGLTGLTDLSLDNNGIQDITPLVTLSNLSYLAINDNFINLIVGSDNSDALATITTNNPGIFILQDNQSVYIPDAALEALIRTAISKPTGDISYTDMLGLTQLFPNESGVTDLTGLEYASNLQLLSIFGEDIADLTPLEGLTSLTDLYIQNSASLVDISPLANMTWLENLGLDGNQITDISALISFTNLEYLSVTMNILDLSPGSINSIDLATIAGNNPTAFISSTPQAVYIPDANLRAKLLALLDRSSGNITQAEMASLNGAVFLAFGHISDLTGLEYLINATTLDIGVNEFSDLTPLANLTQLTGIKMSSNNVSDISPLANLTNLESLIIFDNSISDLSPLVGLTKLKTLNASSLGINTLDGIEQLTNLTHLDIRSNDISDISELASLTNLEVLGLGNLGLTDISPLAGLTNLSTLILHDNQLTSVQPLANLHKLSELQLQDNLITNIDPLLDLEDLLDLRVQSNYLRIYPGGDDRPAIDTFERRVPNFEYSSQYIDGRDPALTAYFQQQYDTNYDLANATNFTIPDGLGVTSLEGFQYASNLESIDLGDNPIADLTPLSVIDNPSLDEITVGNPDALDWDLDHANVAAIEQLLDDGVDLNGLLVPVDAMQIRIETAGNDLRITYGPYLGGRFFHRNFDLNNESGWHDIMLNGISEASRPLEYSGTTTGPSSPEDSSFYRFSNTSKSIIAE